MPTAKSLSFLEASKTSDKDSVITSLTGVSVTTDLAVVQQLHNTLDLPERDRGAAEAVAAGLGDGFTGHSGRIGMGRRMVAAGAPSLAVQRQGRWRQGDMVSRYPGARRSGRPSSG